MLQRFFLVLLACTSILHWGCRSSRHATFNSKEYNAEKLPAENKSSGSATVDVRSEQIVAIDYSKPKANSEIYFVILGSFRVLENAKKFQNQLRNEGFTPNVLQNYKGLYRISVYSYDDIDLARAKVVSIRNKHSKYSDAWVLRRQL